MKDIFRQLDKIEEFKQKVFDLWLRGKTLEITPPFLNVAKEVGKEFYNRYKRIAKIKIIN